MCLFSYFYSLFCKFLALFMVAFLLLFHMENKGWDELWLFWVENAANGGLNAQKHLKQCFGDKTKTMSFWPLWAKTMVFWISKVHENDAVLHFVVL